MKLLMVGGAGHVGSIVRPALEREHDCWYFDRRPVVGAESRTTLGDINDDGAVQRVLAPGFDAVIHLAMGAAGPDGYKNIDAAFSVNVKGTYRLMHHVLSAGIDRFICTSTLSVFAGIGEEQYFDENTPPDAWATYGLSKRLAEQICLAAHQHYPDAIIPVLRLNLPVTEADWPRYRYVPGKPGQNRAIGPKDLGRLYLAALALNKPGVHIVQASGDLEGHKLPNTRATELLGWSPKNE